MVLSFVCNDTRSSDSEVYLSALSHRSAQSRESSVSLISDLRSVSPHRHALHAWVPPRGSPLATCALPKGVCYLLTRLT